MIKLGFANLDEEMFLKVGILVFCWFERAMVFSISFFFHKSFISEF